MVKKILVLKKTVCQWCAAQSQRIPEPLSIDTTGIATPQSIFPSVRQLSKVFDFIEANYQRPITLHEVAQAVGYSRCYLTHLVRLQTGKTVYRWIVERRMVEACSLLLETNQTVDQIAEAVGYQDTSHKKKGGRLEAPELIRGRKGDSGEFIRRQV